MMEGDIFQPHGQVERCTVRKIDEDRIHMLEARRTTTTTTTDGVRSYWMGGWADAAEEFLERKLERALLGALLRALLEGLMKCV